MKVCDSCKQKIDTDLLLHTDPMIYQPPMDYCNACKRKQVIQNKNRPVIAELEELKEFVHSALYGENDRCMQAELDRRIAARKGE